MKKIMKIAAVAAMLAAMCISMTACGEKTFHTDGESHGGSGSYVHTATSGARVEIQDGGKSFMYRMLCDKCGHDMGQYPATSSGGTHTEDHTCPSCGENVHVVIETTVVE